MFRKKIEQQVADELYQCRRDLLEAEGILERAEANVAMLRKRLSRLAQASSSEIKLGPKKLAEVGVGEGTLKIYSGKPPSATDPLGVMRDVELYEALRRRAPTPAELKAQVERDGYGSGGSVGMAPVTTDPAS